MTVTLEDFCTGGGWYLKVNGRTVATLLPSDIQYIVNRCGSMHTKSFVTEVVEQEYAKQLEKLRKR